LTESALKTTASTITLLCEGLAPGTDVEVVNNPGSGNNIAAEGIQRHVKAIGV
jgi:hypothetical protein